MPTGEALCQGAWAEEGHRIWQWMPPLVPPLSGPNPPPPHPPSLPPPYLLCPQNKLLLAGAARMLAGLLPSTKMRH